MRPLVKYLLPACAMAALLACSGGRGEDMSVRRGAFTRRLVLTGALEAVKSDDVLVPKLPQWQTTIRWMERDGARVTKGQKILELDNLAFSGTLEDKRLAAVRAKDELARQVSQNALLLEQKTFTLEQRRANLAKATIDAAVPLELLAKRDYEDRQLALERAKVEFEKAKDDLAAFTRGAEADLAVKRIALEKADREVRTAEEAIAVTTMTAPRDGFVEVGEHPWEGRKFQLGDSVFVGLKVMSIPDLSVMRVAADLSDVDDGKVIAGMPCDCRLDAFPEELFKGKVLEVIPIAREIRRSPLRRAFRVLVSLDRSLPELMRSGMSVKVEVELDRREGALLAPRAAFDLASDPPLARLRGGRFVPVRLGPCSALHCVVEEGLKEGQKLEPCGVKE